MPTALIVGVGGLGCSAAPILAAAGIDVTLCDFDVIEERNLGRQDLFETEDVGKRKVDVAAAKLRAAQTFAIPFEPSMVEGHDVVLDCTDEPGTRALIHQACLQHRVPLAWAGVAGDIGQCAIVIPGNGPCLRCLWAGVGEPMACDDNTDAGMLRRAGKRQGHLALDVIAGKGVAGTLALLDESERTIQFPRNPACAACSNL